MIIKNSKQMKPRCYIIALSLSTNFFFFERGSITIENGIYELKPADAHAVLEYLDFMMPIILSSNVTFPYHDNRIEDSRIEPSLGACATYQSRK